MNKKRKETSVLNTDSFDKRRFQQIFQMSKGLHQIERIEEIPFFKELLGDIWASLYKMKPKLKEEDKIPQHLQINKQFMKYLLNTESYQDYHEISKLDDFVAAVGTIKFGEGIHDWLEKQKEENEKLQQLMEQFKKAMEQLQNEGTENQNESNESKENDNQKTQQNNHLNDLISELSNVLGHELNVNRSFEEIIESAIHQTKEIKRSLETLLGGIKAGSGQGELQKMPLRNKLELAEILSKSKKVQEVAKWAGKFIPIARSKQKTKHKNSVERSGVEMGDDLERLLPSELIQYINPKTKREFLRRLAEKETLQYEKKGKEKLGKGSIILCLDQSGSMEKLETQSKGFALAIMAIARKQKRDFVYIPFSHEVNKIREFEKGKIQPREMIEIAEEFLNGGTDFEQPLKKAINFIAKDKFKNGDVIFITDGESKVSDAFLTKFNEIKKAKKFNVLSLIIGGEYFDTVKKFSDKTIRIKNFNDEGSFKAFEI